MAKCYFTRFHGMFRKIWPNMCKESCLDETMKICEYKRSRLFLTFDIGL